MCNCIKEQEKAAEKYVKENKVPSSKNFVRGSNVSCSLLFGPPASFRTSSIYEYYITKHIKGQNVEQKSPKKLTLLHVYCPFCGEKYPE